MCPIYKRSDDRLLLHGTLMESCDYVRYIAQCRVHTRRLPSTDNRCHSDTSYDYESFSQVTYLRKKLWECMIHLRSCLTMLNGIPSCKDRHTFLLLTWYMYSLDRSSGRSQLQQIDKTTYRNTLGNRCTNTLNDCFSLYTTAKDKLRRSL